MKNIQISIFSIQDIGYDREGILTKTTGTYSFENGYHKVHYCELDEHGTATDNTLLFSNEKMELSKSGSVAAHFLFMSLEKTPEEWADAILLAVKKNMPIRKGKTEEVKAAGFDSGVEANKLLKYYEDLIASLA